jgi:hypothetical protein
VRWVVRSIRAAIASMGIRAAQAALSGSSARTSAREEAMDEQDIRDAEWARALLHRVVRLALLRASWELAQMARELRP